MSRSGARLHASLIAMAALWLWPCLALAQVRTIPIEREELRGTIAGRVCRDENSDGQCSEEEPGVANVRIVLETGAQVLTDADGRYHLAAVSSRTPDTLGGMRLLPGRHRVKPDVRGLLPGARIVPHAATVEVPLAGLVLQDFAVQAPSVELREVRPAYEAAPPTGRLEADNGITFTVAGQATAGEQVRVMDSEATVGADGVYRAEVGLHPGHNEVPIRVTSPQGAVRLFVQRIDVVKRPGGALVIPRELAPVARVQLPGAADEPASAGSARLHVQGPPGTVVGHPGGELVIGNDGSVDVPVELAPGENVVPLRIQRPGEPAQDERLEIPARARPFVVGLLEGEATFRLGSTGLLEGARLYGHGAAHAEVPLGHWLLQGELDLRDQDLADARAFGPGVLWQPRDVLNLERALDPERYAYTFADQSTTVVPNAPDARVRLELSHPQWGSVGFGTYRAQFSDAEVGRYQRELFGPWVRLHTDQKAPVSVGVEAFGSPGASDSTTGLATRPAHVEFLSTGGSLFYLPHGTVARGSESLRIVVRDGLTGVPYSERHLVRGVDYELDALSGRILLAQPLSFAVATPFLSTDVPTAGLDPVLVADYEYLDATSASRSAVGGSVQGHAGPLRGSFGAVQEAQGAARYRLLRGEAGVQVGSLWLSVDAAYSQGRAHGDGDVALSSSGGIDFEQPDAYAWTHDGSSGWALSARLRGPTVAGGRIDASYRRRTPSFSDESWDARGPLSQVSALVEQPLGPIVLGALGDARTTVDPREPFARTEIGARTLEGYAAYRAPRFELRLEAKDQDLTLDARAPGDLAYQGARTSIGLSARYRVLDRLWLSAGHRQNVSARGGGPGAYDDTFSSVGADVQLDERSTIGLHGGWGPKLGPLVWAQGNVASGKDVYYGSYSVDADGPDFGERRAVTGARTALGDGTAVFVEDVGAHDATTVRLARAVGFSYVVASGFEVGARYERGLRTLLDLPSPSQRDAGGFSASFIRERVQLSGRAELRFEHGGGLDRVQRLVSGAASVSLLRNVQLQGRLNWSDTYEARRRIARLLEASAGLAWRIDPAMVVIHYGVERELSPLRPELGEWSLQRVSVMPSVKLGDRFAVAAGAHAGWSTVDGSSAFVLSGSLRPSVRVVGGLEVAAELARRSAAPDGGELSALRGEVGYRFSEELLVAGGYSFFGYSGLGLTPEPEQTDRVYLRAEAAW